MPADDFGGFGLLYEDQVAMVRMYDEVGTFEEVVQFGDRVYNSKALQFLYLPSCFDFRQGA
jgi:hypothetical protein